MSIFKSNYSNDTSDGCCSCRDFYCYGYHHHKPTPCPDTQFLSNYLEAIGNTQNVDTGGDIVFDIDPDALDIAGNGIEINESGTTFTITRTGLYHVEWSINLESGTDPITIGLLENGAPTSAISSVSQVGNLSSGALINVNTIDIPLTIRLHNFGNPIHIVSPTVFQNTAASIRILRFADGANT